MTAAADATADAGSNAAFGGSSSSSSASSSSSMGSSKKHGYKCQRCRNHNMDVVRRGHAEHCPYKGCSCDQCELVERRTETFRRLCKRNSVSKTAADPPESTSSNGQRRMLRCAKCANHDVKSMLKNHKNACPYQKCSCTMCRLVDDYRSILKDQIKARRLQKKRAYIMGVRTQMARTEITQLTSDLEGQQRRQSVIVSCGQPSALTTPTSDNCQSSFAERYDRIDCGGSIGLTLPTVPSYLLPDDAVSGVDSCSPSSYFLTGYYR